MLNFARMPLVAAGLVGFAMVATAIAVAQDNSSSTNQSNPSSSVQSEGEQAAAQTGQPSSATNPSNLPKTESGTTEQQSKAAVVDPHASTQNSATDQSSSEKAGGAQNANTQEWPAPQRYDAGRDANSSRASGQGGATLGINVVGSEDGQGVVVARIRPGTPAEQMGLRPRDRILNLNGQPVASVDEFISVVRGMDPGTEIQLSIERDGNARDIGGRLAALRDAIAAGEGPAGDIVGRAREFIGRDRYGRTGDNYRGSRENMQTSYEDSQSGRQPSGNLESRLSRVEQQIDQLMRDVSEIRTSLRSNSATGPALPDASAPGQPATRGPSPFRPTPGQPPSGLQPQSR